MLTQKRLKEVLHYDPETGAFTRLACFQRPDVVGKVDRKDTAGWYTRIAIDGCRHYAHRLAWLYMTGLWPSAEIDHRNCIKSDNSWKNLRDVTSLTNKQNQRTALSSSKSGILGVSWDSKRGKWVGRIKVGAVYKYVGRFVEIKDAQEAYLLAKREYHEGCTI